MGEIAARRRAAAACGAAVVAALALSGCAYSYEGQRTPSATASAHASPEPSSPASDPLFEGPLASSWASTALSRAPGVGAGEGIRHGVGALKPVPGEDRTSVRLDLPAGQYRLTMVCRVAGLVDLAVTVDGKPNFTSGWGCGLPHTISVPITSNQDWELSVSLRSPISANFAYRLDPPVLGQS